MPSTVFSSSIFRDMFGTPAIRAVFSDGSKVAHCVEVAVALAEAEAVAAGAP